MNSESELVLDTPSGAVRGLIDNGVACFRAIPYATPPTGDLRFEAPVAAPAWGGLRDAIHVGAVAPQSPSRLRHVMGNFHREQSEDCLTLTVWTPQACQGPLPVLVWFHGGAFMTGGGDLPWYDGANLAREGGVVVVGVNYRLGALGFLRATGVSQGNLGIKDQELSLQWVARHIAAFGGDPAQVTLMGQSAGALSIALLLSRSTPLNARRAILMSAPLGLPLPDVETAEQVGQAFLQDLGIDPQSAAAAEKAKQASIPDLMRATAAAARFQAENLAQQGGGVAPPFLPIGDGGFLAKQDQHPKAMSCAAERLDVLIGTTRDESAAFGAAVGDELMTRSVFEDASVAWAQRASGAGRAAFLYRFDWAPRGSVLGAAHCIELPFVFGTFAAFNDAAMLAGGSESAMRLLSGRMRSSWLSFVKDGRPASPDKGAWSPVGHDWRTCMHLDAPELSL